MKRRGFTLSKSWSCWRSSASSRPSCCPSSTARLNARTATCASNLKQIGLALRQYAQDNNGFYPEPDGYGLGRTCSWPDRIFPYVRSEEIFECPETEGLTYKAGCVEDDTSGGGITTFNGSYDMNDLRVPLGRYNIRLSETILRYPTSTILVLDGTGNSMNVGRAVSAQNLLTAGVPLRHDDAANVLFGDGHVKRLNLESLAKPEQWNVLNRR